MVNLSQTTVEKKAVAWLACLFGAANGAPIWFWCVLSCMDAAGTLRVCTSLRLGLVILSAG